MQNLLFYNSLVFFIGMIFLIRHFKTLIIISYSILNILGTVILGGMFLMFINETLICIGYLFIFTPIFKNIIVPLLGTMVIRNIILLAKPIKKEKFALEPLNSN
ncbi:MAG: hypothetical protein ACTSRU_07015 [Candidatus Hodarchaeales archaeon]